MAEQKTAKNRPDPGRLVRALEGELGPAEEQALEQELRLPIRDSGALWQKLELPAAPAVDLLPSLRQRLTGRHELNFRAAPTWARTAAAMASVVGLALGLFLGRPVAEIPNAAVVEETSLFADDESSLAESFWSALESGDEAEDLS